ncbi:DUF4917 family protein [Pseudomonas sp. CCC3.1]|uniref:DUF4917 family protein n=1 Tax=Pseudomonas sp. CCC3.1 TaxID=3048607 RepID=UPI002AC98FD6|nr:DUF4917 family protein [Pseudomonas sp. CCC3.1]MEB0208445.1 DUF4917 family protein [Pseudomonas sp. CCC3.1]WPX37855.1 DUF4917 family protein [Pseudomonas sp. CCC3.1]
MTPFQEFDAELEDWNALNASTPCSGLLLGNGASMAVWHDFYYDSLFEKAKSVAEKPLSQTELSVFDALSTRNFEHVLSALKTASKVNKALAINSASPRKRYYAIKEALINSTQDVHIPWRLMNADTLTGWQQELARYATVYCSNYDLLTPWAVMQAPKQFNDLFDNQSATFELEAALSKSKATRVLYLHGALHLVKNQEGKARKINATEATLLSNFAINHSISALDDVPLFVSESSSDDKRKSIRHSDYLSFCHQQLMSHKDALCIFGHSLGEQDQHLINAVRQAPLKTLCISVYPRSEAFIRFQKNHYTALFADKKLTLRFYNSKTHPLGDTRHSVPVEV